MWKNVHGQVRVKEILRNSFLKRRIPHAMLFHGPEGTGKDAAAVEFAMLINCDSPVNGSDACGDCKSCRDIGALRPPLMRFVTALPAGKNESDDKDPLLSLDKEDADAYLSELALKSADKYHQIRISGANDIRISSIRNLKEQASFTGYSGKTKVFMISQADRMNVQSSNALLKILEEPPEDNILILTTSRINALLPTIVGRCHLLKFDRLNDHEMNEFIRTENPGADEETVRFYAALSQGSIVNCRQIMNEDYLELRDKAIAFVASSITSRYVALGREMDSVISAKDKQRIKRFLLLMSLWFRDAEAVASGNSELVVNVDKIDRLKKFSAGYNSSNYRIMKLIEDASADVDRNIFPELLLTNLSIAVSAEITKK